MEKQESESVSGRESEPGAPTGSHELDAFLGKAFDEKPIWSGLYESIRDMLFPSKLPPLELTSTPIPVVDPMAVKANPWAIGIAAGVNVAILALLLFLGVRQIVKTVTAPKLDMTKVDITEFKAPKMATAAGGGGGSPDKFEAIKGRIPPRVQTLDTTSKIQMPVPTIDVQKDIAIPDDPSLPNFGMSNSSNVKVGSLGNGAGMGVGNGNGSGYGNGSGGNIGGGVYQVGGGITAPVPLNHIEPEFSDEARRERHQGECVISMIIDAQGNPQNPRVVSGLGMGLDEKALEAVLKYRFKPAKKDGKPVPVRISVMVNFRLF